MRLRPGFLRANSSRNVSDASTTSARDGGGSDDNGGSRKVREIFSRPTLLPPRHSRGNSDSASACNARTSSGTSQTSVASLLSSRGILSPTAAYLGNNDRRGRGSGSYRRRASTAPVDPGRRGVDHDKPASRWGRRRSSGAVRAASEVIIVKAIDLNDQGLGVLAGGGLGAPRTIRGGRWGASFDEGVDLDDEQLTRRRRGDGDGVSDEEDEGEDEDDRDGDRGVLGKPSLGPWKDGLLADRSGGVLFSAGATLDENPAGSTPALFCDEDGTASSRASAKPGGSPVEAAVPAEFGSGEGRRQHRTAVAAAAEAATVSPDVERQAQERVNGRVNGRQDTELAEAAEDNDAWWSLRPVRQEDGSRWWSSTQDTEKGDSGSWWSTRKSGASSSDGGGDERRWSSASSLLAQAVSALSPWNPKPPPASPPQAPAATAVYLPPTTVAAEDSAVESRADGGSTERQGLVCGVGERAAVVPEVVLPGEKAGAERQRLLLESSFFCKENRTEELRVVLRSRELRAGFKQASLLYPPNGSCLILTLQKSPPDSVSCFVAGSKVLDLLV